MQFDESLVDLAAALRGHPVDAVLIMCSNPEAASAGLPILRDAYDGPIGIYPNIGYNPTGPLANSRSLRTSFRARGRHPADGPLSTRTPCGACGGVEGGGGSDHRGCCATGPEHIMAMRPVVKGD